MSGSVTDRVLEARRRVERAITEQVRAVAQSDVAAAEAQRVLAQLAEEFEVSSLREAQELLSSLCAQIQEQLQVIDSELTVAESSEGVG